MTGYALKKYSLLLLLSTAPCRGHKPFLLRRRWVRRMNFQAGIYLYICCGHIKIFLDAPGKDRGTQSTGICVQIIFLERQRKWDLLRPVVATNRFCSDVDGSDVWIFKQESIYIYAVATFKKNSDAPGKDRGTQSTGICVQIIFLERQRKWDLQRPVVATNRFCPDVDGPGRVCILKPESIYTYAVGR